MNKIFSTLKIDNDSPKALLIHIGIMATIILILVLLFFYTYLPYTTRHGQSITVPNIVGMKSEELDDFLSVKDLKFEVTDSIYTTKYPPYAVVKQYPEEGFQVKEGRKISITLNRKSPEQVKMPQLVGISYKNAQGIAQTYGLTVEPHYVPYKYHGLVLKQMVDGKEIKDGALVYQGQKILLEVGDINQNQPFLIPNYVSQNIDEVEIAAKGQNLEIDVIDEASDQADGTVLRQKPESGPDKTIKPGETITVWVAKEKDDTKVEDGQ